MEQLLKPQCPVGKTKSLCLAPAAHVAGSTVGQLKRGWASLGSRQTGLGEGGSRGPHQWPADASQARKGGRALRGSRGQD